MADLRFSRHTDDPLGSTWTLSGPNGAVVFGPMGIDAHSPVPMYRDGSGPHSDNCPTTHGACWVDGSSLEGRKLHDRWDNAGRDDSVIRAELERWYHEELSTPVPVVEGSQVAGEVGPGGSGPNLAATGAGDLAQSPVPVAAQKGFGRRNRHCSNCGDERGGPFGHEISECRYRSGMTAEEVAEILPEERRQEFWDLCVDRYLTAQGIEVPVPVAAHRHVAGWGGVPGECGVECACGTTFDNFDTIAEAAELLDEHIAAANPPVPAQPLEISDEFIETVAKAEYAYDCSGDPADFVYPWDETLASVRNEYVRRAWAGLQVAIPLLRQQWENAPGLRWGSGPLVDHNPETRRTQREMDADLYENWVANADPDGGQR